VGLFSNKNKKEAPTLIPEPLLGERKRVDVIKEKYNDGVSFKRAQGFYEDWPEYERFWNGDQWPQPTPETRNYPRPVTNQFAAIIEQKVMGVTYERPEIFFDPLDPEPAPAVSMMPTTDPQAIQLQQLQQMRPTPIDAAEALSQVAKHLWHKTNMGEAVDDFARSAALLGTGILFSPWDNTLSGGGEGHFYVGDIPVYEIDAADFFPGNPFLPPKELQKQPYIIVAERVPIEEMRATYRAFAPEIVDYIKPSMSNHTQIYDQQLISHGTDNEVDLIHFWEKVALTEDDEDYEPLTFVDEAGNPLLDDEGDEIEAPFLPQFRLDYTVICEDRELRHEKGIYKHGKYPFVAMQWLPKRKSFFGKPESADIINNQKEENRLAGIALLSAYNTGLPNIRYKPNFVDKKFIVPGPGGNIIPDNSPPGAWSVDFMQPPTPAGHIPGLRAFNIDGMKDVSGVHEAWSGKAPGARLNASAIMALQEAAGIRIRGAQRRLHRAIRDLGELWLAHWKEFYEEPRLFKVMGENRLEGFIWFQGTDYADMEFDVRVQASAASPYSRSLFMAHLDKLFEGGMIGPDEYLEMLPADVFPKAGWIIKNRAKKVQQAMEAQVQQQSAAVQAMVDHVIQQAAEKGVPITEETLKIMLQLLDRVGAPGDLASPEGAPAPEAQPGISLGGGEQG